MPLDAQVQGLLEAGDRDGAACAVIEALGPPVLRFLHSKLRQEAAASDAFSLWADDVWQGLPAFHFEASLEAWSYQLAWDAAQKLRNEPWRRHGDP